ncbi:hypothetical protein CCH79_00009839 [Gambusia affinis]|uniref:G-protein coupled receptors family 1 profile domain-containing protein n=1 Tax=Gambusia affinis TaxID=33528 RepID=A0A315V592_GAMAF|nr:hypothetical protein CCH79_00009839 [Gambusia affinis]
MFNTSVIEPIFAKKEDIAEVINGTLLLVSNVSVTTVGSSPTAKWNESCGEQLLDFGRPEKIIIGVMLAMITAVTVMGNTLVVIAVCVVKKLRQPSNYLLVSLAVADLSVAIVVMPFVIVTDLTGGKWLFGDLFCNIFIGMDVMCCTASIMTLCVISVDSLSIFEAYEWLAPCSEPFVLSCGLLFTLACDAAYPLESVVHSVGCCEGVFLHHGNDSAFIHHSYLLWTSMMCQTVDFVSPNVLSQLTQNRARLDEMSARDRGTPEGLMMLLQELDRNYHAVEREFAPLSCVKADWSMKCIDLKSKESHPWLSAAGKHPPAAADTDDLAEETHPVVM